MEGTIREISDVYSAYISKDGKIINLPVPIDSYLWEIKMGCDKICQKCQGQYNQVFGRPIHKCMRATDMNCGTIFIYYQRITLDIDNIGKILRRYEITVFDTKEKAQAAGQKLMKKRIELMRSCGFNIDDGGKLIGYTKEDNNTSIEGNN